MGELLLGGGERPVRQLDLARVDADLALVAERGPGRASARNPSSSRDGHDRLVDGRDPGQAGRERDLAAGVQHLVARRRTPSADVGDVVLGAEVDGAEALRGDSARASATPSAVSMPPTSSAGAPRVPVQLVAHLLDLGQRSSLGTTIPGRAAAPRPPRGRRRTRAARRVDPHQHDGRRHGAERVDGRRRPRSRAASLSAGCDRVLEVDDGDVGGEPRDLGDHVGPAARQEQHAAHRAASPRRAGHRRPGASAIGGRAVHHRGPRGQADHLVALVEAVVLERHDARRRAATTTSRGLDAPR